MRSNALFLAGTCLLALGVRAQTPVDPGSASAPSAASTTPGTTAAPAPTGGDGTQGDILVTARRRQEAVQKVPLAISVTDAKAIDATGSFNVLKLTQIQPTLQFYSTNPRNTTVNIRGLGVPFGLTNDGIEPGVGVYIDQVYFARIGSATLDFLDVDRVEVLRGPQGTLYGKNTTAGAINITSKAPSFSPEGSAEVSFGNLGFKQGKASISGPLVDDKLAVRLGVSVTHRDGTIYNVTTKDHVNEQDNLGLRGSLLWKATDTLRLTLSGDYNRQNPNCCVQIYVRTGATQRPLNRQFAALAAAFNYAPPSTNPFDRVTDLDAPIRAKQTIYGASLRGELELGGGTLTSVSAWRVWDWKPSNDRDFTGLPITTVSQNPSHQKQYTQELRYAGTSGKIDYVGGLFGFYQRIDTSGSQVQGAAASRFLLNPGATVPPGSSGCAPVTANACNPAVLNGLTSLNDIHFKNTSAAAYGQLTWHVTDKLRLQPGLRLNYDRKSGSYVATVFTGSGSTTLNSDQRGVLAPQSYDPRFSKWNVSGDFTASYDVARDVLAYATYAKSFKSGGINLSGLPLDANNQPILSSQTVKPEKVNHFEVGLKTQFFDRRATLNLAGFWTDIRDYQATVTNGQLGVIRGYLANAQKVRTRGLELDFTARPVDQFNVYFSGAFTDAKYVKFTDAPCPPELSGGSALTATNSPSPAGTPGGVSPNFCDISGQWLPGVSRWAFSHGAEYRIPAQLFGGSEFYVGYDGSYRSKFSSNPSRSAYTDIAGYYLGNVRAGIRINSRWDAFGWVRNVFDKNYFEVLALQSGSTGLVVGQPADPRTYGVTVKARF